MSNQPVRGLFERRPERDADVSIGDVRLEAWWYRQRGTLHAALRSETFEPCIVVECRSCLGSGDCPSCGGAGHGFTTDEDGSMKPWSCERCDGISECVDCGGNGAHFRPTKRSIEPATVC